MNAFKNCKDNVRRSWKIINDVMNRKADMRPVDGILSDGVMLTAENDIANAFNNYFSTIATNLDQDIPHNDCPPLRGTVPTLANSFGLFPVGQYEIERIIGSLKNKNFGRDKIPVDVLKYSCDILSAPICQLINKSFSTGVFPAKLKPNQLLELAPGMRFPSRYH